MRSPLLFALALAAAPSAWPQSPPPATEMQAPKPARSAVSLGPPPATLVWLVIDDGTRKTVASASQVAALGAMTGVAAERGIELKFPTLDGSDLARVDADLQGGHEQVVLVSEVVMDEGRVYSCGSRDSADRRTPEPPFRKGLSRRSKNLAACVRAPRSSPARVWTAHELA